MNTRFTLQHCGNPLESLLSDSEDNIIFRASIIGAGPYSIKKTYYDWLSAEVHDEYRSQEFRSLQEIKIRIQKEGLLYLSKKSTLCKKRSNDTHGYWVREIEWNHRVYLRVYALPHEDKFSLHKITLIGKSMVDFNESNPGLLGYASTEEEADQFLKREIDKAYLLA